MRIATTTRLVGFAVAIAVAAVIGVCVVNLDKIKIGGKQFELLIDNKELTADILPPPLYVVEAYALVLSAETPAEARAVAERLGGLRGEFKTRLDFWRAEDLDPRLRTLLIDQADPAADRFWQVAETRYLPAVTSGDPVALNEARHELKAAYGAQRAVVDAMVPIAAEIAVRKEAEAARTVVGVQWLAGIMMLALAALTAFNMLVISRRVMIPLNRIREAMLALAGGALEREPPYLSRRDEIGEMAGAVQVFRRNALDLAVSRREQLAAEAAAAEDRARTDAERQAQAAEQQQVLEVLATALNRLSQADVSSRLTDLPPAYASLQSDFNRALEVLGDTLGSVVEVVEQFHLGTEQLSVASDQLSRRTERQAASLEETAAAVEQLTTTVRTAAGGAAEAAALAAAARGEADASAVTVERVETAMQAIADSSLQIASFVSVVDQIAFQTNLLALNAGVEAARAGDSGRGFAVVAQEVRDLAQRSAEAAREIKVLMEQSGDQVRHGVEMVGETGRVLGAISSRVAQIDGLVSQLAATAREQAQGLQEVNIAVGEMDQVTQANAAMVEESTAALQTLRNDAEQLRGVVGAFRLTSANPSTLEGMRSRLKVFAGAGGGGRS